MKRLSAGTMLAQAGRGCASLLAALLLLSACGQKGPLYLPGHGKDTPWPVRSNPSAAGTAAGEGAPAPGTSPSNSAQALTAPEGRNDVGGASPTGGSGNGGDVPAGTPEKPNNAPQAPQ